MVENWFSLGCINQIDYRKGIISSIDLIWWIKWRQRRARWSKAIVEGWWWWWEWSKVGAMYYSVRLFVPNTKEIIANIYHKKKIIKANTNCALFLKSISKLHENFRECTHIIIYWLHPTNINRNWQHGARTLSFLPMTERGK